MPRIDPFSLLKCLSVLLGPTGGIKSKEEVHRLANLMTKFSKKLVSKCIYIQILKTTNTDLLSQFMGAGGWNLIHMWLTDGILAKNWALIQELLELLLLCPVDIERLKSNNCPKLIKGLSKEGSHQGVRILASKLVEQWLKIVKGEAPPNSVPAQIMLVSNSTTSVTTSTSSTTISTAGTTTTTSTSTTSSASSNSAVASSQSQSQFSSSDNNNVNGCSNNSHNNNNNENAIETVQVQDLQFNSSNSVGNSTQEKTVQLRLMQQQKPQICIVTTASQNPVPVFKITIRDGNEVLTKVETDVTNILLNNDSNVESGKKSALEEKKVSEGKQVDGKSVGSGDEVEGVTNKVSASEVTETSGKDKDKDSESKAKDKSEVSSDGKSISDKENRDSHKKEEKKSSSEKKSSGSSSSSSRPSSSSKHSSSSSHRSSSSSSHKSSSHKPSSSSSSSNSRSGSSSSKDKSKDHRHHHSKHSSSSSSSSSSSKRSDRDKERQKKDQAEKDKATLEKIQSQSISSKIGKIPKKKAEDESNKSLERKSSTDSRDSSKENKQDAKKSATSSVPEKKNISISIENRKNSQDAVTTRPKTVKTYNSKFRSTGLEEEVKPPPPRSVKKPNAAIEKKIMPVKVQPLKRTSPLRETSALPSEKKAKLALDATSTTSPSDEKKGGIKLIPPKPKPMVLQESDMFMDALTASTKSKEPRKRKRKTSISKDGPSLDPKVKIDSTNHDNSRDSTPPPTSPASADEKSPLAVKPNFKFYQDTLETDEDKEEKLKNEEEKHRDDDDDDMRDHHHRHHHDDDDSRQSKTPTPENDSEEAKISDSLEEPSESGDTSKKDETGSQNSDEGLKSVLLHQKRKGPKKTLKWKTELESIRYFELDETERVNVTKTFTDMKQMEKQNEREAFQMARKLSNEDLMEERTIWKPLIPIDLPPPLVEPGKDSKEKDIQYAREKGILQALYFNRSMIPDSPAEPDEEKHHIITDPKTIPLDDLTGNKESEKDFTSIPWPEPKPQLLPTSLNPPMTNYHFQTYPHTQQPQPQQPGMINSGMPGPQGPMGMMPQMPQGMMGHMNQMDLSQMPGNPNAAPGGGGGWRTGDGKVVVPDVNVNAMPPNMTGGFPQNMDTGAGPMMPPPGMMGRPPMYNQQDGYNMMGGPPMPHDDMGYNNFQGPPPPGMYGPHPGPNFPGPRAGPPPPPLHASRGRGNPGWFRGGGPLHPPPMRGSGPPPPGWRSGWRNNSNQPMPPVCRQFTKNGYCRGADKCQFLHPGVNCPPF